MMFFLILWVLKLDSNLEFPSEEYDMREKDTIVIEELRDHNEENEERFCMLPPDMETTTIPHTFYLDTNCGCIPEYIRPKNVEHNYFLVSTYLLQVLLCACTGPHCNGQDMRGISNGFIPYSLLSFPLILIYLLI